MRLSIAALVLLLATASFSFADRVPQATTTLTQQTSNNTSAADGFRGQPNGNLGAGNVSKLPIRSLLYPGAETLIYAHVVPWWGSKNHVDVGYSSQDPVQVRRQVEDMISRGLDGAIVDWYGPKSYEDRGTKLFLQEAEAHPGFRLIVEIEHGAIEWGSCFPTCSATEAVIQLATYVSRVFFDSPAYARKNGRPILMEFGMETLPGDIDWARVKDVIPGNPIWIHRNTGGFKKLKSGGAFAWLQNQRKDKKIPGWDGSPYLKDFYQAAKAAQGMEAYGSVYKGFDDELAPWSPPGGRLIEQGCGQTWLKTFDVINQYYSASEPLPSLQLVTWNDYEEGTALEPGIDNCVQVSAQVNDEVLSWEISGGKENTLAHYVVYVSSDGEQLAPLAEVAPGTRTLNLGSFALARGKYKVYVQAVGKPSIRNQMSPAVTYQASGASGGGTVLADSEVEMRVNPGTLKVARGRSTQTEVMLAPKKPVSGRMVLACSNLPPGVTCSFSPAIIRPGSSPASALLTIDVNGSQVAVNGAAGGNWFALMFPSMGLVGMVVVGSSRRSRARIAGAMVLLGLLALAGCGGGSPSLLSRAPARPGTYEITVSAVSTQVRQFTTATLVIE